MSVGLGHILEGPKGLSVSYWRDQRIWGTTETPVYVCACVCECVRVCARGSVPQVPGLGPQPQGFAHPGASAWVDWDPGAAAGRTGSPSPAAGGTHITFPTRRPSS